MLFYINKCWYVTDVNISGQLCTKKKIQKILKRRSEQKTHTQNWVLTEKLFHWKNNIATLFSYIQYSLSSNPVVANINGVEQINSPSPTHKHRYNYDVYILKW